MKTINRFILFLLCAFIPASAYAGSQIDVFDLDTDFTINVKVLNFATIQLEKGETVPDGYVFLGDNTLYQRCSTHICDHCCHDLVP